MKIFDCFMFYDEEMLLDIRLNILNKFVDKFVIVESTFTHSGQKRNLVFDLQKYKKFKDKMLKNIPLGRVAKESDVATAVAFLAADSSEMITGTSLLVDGGWTAQ